MYLAELVGSSQNNNEKKKANESIKSTGHRRIALAFD